MTADDPTPHDGETIADEQFTEYAPDGLGARRQRTGSTRGEAIVDAGVRDGTTALQVDGYWLDDEPASVEIATRVDGADVRLSLSPDDAREFAEQVAQAARFAKEGE